MLQVYKGITTVSSFKAALNSHFHNRFGSIVNIYCIFDSNISLFFADTKIILGEIILQMTSCQV